MPMNFSDDAVVVADVAGIDDAEALLAWLQQRPGAGVDLSACSHLHASCLQALMAGGARVSAFPADAALAAWLRHTLNQTNEETATP